MKLKPLSKATIDAIKQYKHFRQLDEKLSVENQKLIKLEKSIPNDEKSEYSRQISNG